jgi:hypothetical protein
MRVISVSKVIDALGVQHLPYMEQGKPLKEWCAKNNALYYARPAESFSEEEAMREALALGKSTLVLENMS